MAIPIINRSTSVLEFRKFEEWAFQPSAANLPTYWNIAGLPNGMVYDFALGKIAGAATEGGVFDLGIIAGNDDGVSAQMNVCLGIAGDGIATPSNEIDVTIDLQGRQPMIGGASSLTEPILFIKSNDKMRFRIRFTKGGVVADLDLASLFFSLKADHEEPNLITASSFVKEGAGDNTSYLLYVDISGALLDGAIEDHAVQPPPGQLEIPQGQYCNMLSEFEWVVTHALEIAGTSTTRVSSMNFITQITTELHANS